MELAESDLLHRFMHGAGGNMEFTSLELRVVLAHFCSSCLVSSSSLPAMLMEESFTCCTANAAADLKALIIACISTQGVHNPLRAVEEILQVEY